MASKLFEDADLIATLNMNNGNVTRTAEQLGVTRAAVIKRRDALPEGAFLSREEWAVKKVDALKDLQRKILQSITPDDIKKASAAQRITMAAILEDKIRLAEGKATEHIAHQMESNLSDEDRAILQEFIARRTQQVVSQIEYHDNEPAIDAEYDEIQNQSGNNGSDRWGDSQLNEEPSEERE